MKTLNSLKFLQVLVVLISLLFILSCSSVVPKNKWQYDAVNMTQAYQKHFLQGKSSRANVDLRHAKKLSKQSSNLKTLIDVELTACAMQVAVLNPQSCEHIRTLLQVQANTEQEAYLDLLSSTLEDKKIILLPKQYQSFTQALKEKNVQAINTELQDIQTLSSKLIASALAIKYINDENISILIEALSFSGYKAALLPWLRVQASKEVNQTNKDLIQEKIKILLSK